MIVETDRLKIRNLALEDKKSLFEIYSDKEAMRFRGSKPFETIEEVVEMLNRTFQKLESKEEFRYAVDLKENNEIIGTFLIKPISENECEIGYSIGKNYWGRGYGKELVKGMLKYIKKLPFKTIVATSRKENISSIMLLESVGFKLFPEKEINNCRFFEYFLEQ
ncbi:N-acetyltransferase [Flavobacterium rhamnosiphilum]|uniref:N-acetyltransferase n=1 Tax=Flavobacterium rhamnosiphilum TaxID=2541724 RepID=A0A4R5F8X8_9FLAO|nr:GNAT family N-acetyltransferase [Flavobacterium rhamnosiphilum]TDE44913.1 N-acetyltransferase [Flavobacterium rhamnosiphilum]